MPRWRNGNAHAWNSLCAANAALGPIACARKGFRVRISVSALMDIPVEPVPSRAITQETGDVFVDHKLAEGSYKEQWTVLDGGAFEEKMLAERYPKGSHLESYLRMKLARARADPAYAERVRAALGEENVTLLLALCRWCSYAGGPGMPDLVLVKGERWALRFLTSALLPEQKLFALLAQAAIPSVDIGIGRVVPAESGVGPSKLPIPAEPLLKSVLASRGEGGLSATMKAVEAEIRGLAGQATGASTAAALGALTVQRDELAWLQHQQLGMPFALLEKWAKVGSVTREEILERALAWEREVRAEQELFVRLRAEAEADAGYAALGRFKNEETARRKVAWMMERFGIGESRAKQLYGFIEG